MSHTWSLRLWCEIYLVKISRICGDMNPHHIALGYVMGRVIV